MTTRKTVLTKRLPDKMSKPVLTKCLPDKTSKAFLTKCLPDKTSADQPHIMEKLDSDLSKKRLSPNWQSTSSYPHTYHCYCCSKHLELRLHTSLRLIVWHVCDCYVFFLLLFQSFCLTATSTRSTGWRACTGRRVSGIFSPVLIGRPEGGDKSFNIIE